VGVFGVATGLIMLVAFPVVALVVCVTIIGLAPGLLTFFAYGSALILTYMLTPVLAGAVLARWLKRGSGLRWDWVVLGAGSLSLISFLPMIGGIIHTILFLSIFSVVVTSAYEALMAHRKAPAPPAVLPEHPIEAHDTGVESKHESS
jgi:hypothetical protein